MNDLFAICTIAYFKKDVDDSDIRSVLEYALDLARKHIDVVKDIFKEEKIPVPIGFRELDVNLNAPGIYTDTFML